MSTRLLLIDDNLPDRVLYRRMLSRAGEAVEVTEAADAHEGLAALDAAIAAGTPFAAVLLDHDLPDENGLDALPKIRSRAGAPPVIMLTGEEDAAVSIEALKRGAADYLMKRRIDEDRLLRTLRGVLERARLEDELADRQRRLSLFYRMASTTDDALFIVDAGSGAVRECNHAARTRLRIETTGPGQAPTVPAGFDTPAHWRKFLDDALREGSARAECAVTTAGDAAVFELTAHATEEQGTAYLVAVGRDITWRLQYERSLREQAQRDGLTGLCTRSVLDERLAEAFGTGAPLTLVLLDLDYFKLYNEALGHPAGDEALKQTARALATGTLRGGAVLARFGGDEFALLLPETQAEAARTVAERLRQAVAATALPHPRSGAGPILSLSVGVAARETTMVDAANLVAAALAATRRARQQGGNRVVVAG